VGIAMTTTILSRRAQLHQTRLVEHLSPFDPAYQIAHEKMAGFLSQKGLPPAGADGMMYRELVRQSTTLAFTDAFLLICFLILSVIPLVFIMKWAKAPAAGGPPPAH
jgi:DHA2 family multidrug resistance protein